MSKDCGDDRLGLILLFGQSSSSVTDLHAIFCRFSAFDTVLSLLVTDFALPEASVSWIEAPSTSSWLTGALPPADSIMLLLTSGSKICSLVEDIGLACSDTERDRRKASTISSMSYTSLVSISSHSSIVEVWLSPTYSYISAWHSRANSKSFRIWMISFSIRLRFSAPSSINFLALFIDRVTLPLSWLRFFLRILICASDSPCAVSCTASAEPLWPSFSFMILSNNP